MDGEQFKVLTGYLAAIEERLTQLAGCIVRLQTENGHRHQALGMLDVDSIVEED